MRTNRKQVENFVKNHFAAIIFCIILCALSLFIFGCEQQTKIKEPIPEPESIESIESNENIILRKEGAPMDNVLSPLKELGFYTDWTFAGIPGGIPEANRIFGESISPGANQTATANAINKAIQAAGDDVKNTGGASAQNLRVVQLTEGVFDVGDNAIELNRPGVILRGMGTGTVIRGTTDNSGAITIGKSGWYAIKSTAVDLTEDAKTGGDRITVTDASIFSVGQILKIDRFADDSLAADGGTEWPNGHNQFMRGKSESEFGPKSSGGERPVSQYIEIAEIQGNVLVLENRINIDFPLTGASGKELYPQVFNTGADEYKYIGLEDMKLQMTAANDDRGNWSWHLPAVNLRTVSCYSWVKNVESDGSFFHPDTNRGFMGRHVELNGYRNHVTGGYFHHSSCVSPGGNGYGIRWHSTDSIIENNICDMLNKPLTGQMSGGGNVIAYNYVPNAIITPWDTSGYPPAAAPDKPQVIQKDWNETAIDLSHGGYSHSDLFEGNYAVNFHTDSTSTNGWEVLFRNHSWGQGLIGTTGGSNNGLAIDGPQGEHASIGNVYLNLETGRNAVVWDKPGENVRNGSIAVYRFNAQTGRGNGTMNEAMGSGLTDKNDNCNHALGRFYWAYDYNYANNEIEPPRTEGWNVPPPDLADSLYLSSAPDYFDGYIWPAVNPFGMTDDERIGELPAKARYDKYYK
jgi:hypothetical protein